MLFYFMDNMTTYYIVQNGSSKSIELHKLICKIKSLEVLLGCRIEVIHVPGTLMIEEGTDGLSRGLWLSPHRVHRSSLTEAALALGPVPYTQKLAWWALEFVGLDPSSGFSLHTTTSPWAFDSIYGQLSLWIPTPEVACMALVKFLEIWVEGATTTSGLFLIPRIMQRDWGNLSKYVVEVGTIYPSLLLPGLPTSPWFHSWCCMCHPTHALYLIIGWTDVPLLPTTRSGMCSRLTKCVGCNKS
jgi:hypothetical protein